MHDKRIMVVHQTEENGILVKLIGIGDATHCVTTVGGEVGSSCFSNLLPY